MSIKLNRRLWLKQATAIALSSALKPSFSFANYLNNKELIFGGGRYQDVANGPFKFVVSQVQTQSGAIKASPTPFFPHGFALTNSSNAYVFEKIGKGGGLINLETMEWIETITSASDRLFYGHGACSKDEKLLFSTETLPNEQGAIGVRDVKSLTYLGDFPTYGSNPHDCHLIDDGKVLLVTNGGGTQESGVKASLCYIDVASQKLLERIEMPDEKFNTGHTAHVKNHQAIVVSAPRKGWGVAHLGAVSVEKNGRLEVLSQPSDVTQNMFGEALSVAVVQIKDLFIATHPTPGMVTFWQLSSNKLIKRLDLPHARGVVLAADQESVWISYHAEAHLIRVNLNTFIADESSIITNTFISGSHLISKLVN